MRRKIKRIIKTVHRWLPARLLASFRKLFYGNADFRWGDVTYQKQLKENALTAEGIAAMEKEVASFRYKPLISVVVPVYNIRREWLERALDSVFDQVYPHWELCIADDASPSPHIKKILESYRGRDPRVKVIYLESNRGMSGSSNAALTLAAGEFVALLDHDDQLSPDSLFEVVKLLNTHPDAGLIYSDEDKLTMSGHRIRPVKKPGWDPDLFLTYNYFCHLVVCRRELITKAGGFRKGFEGSQDYDLLLRITELTARIFHIPKVLYHWRMIPGSAAMVVDAKKEAFEKSKQALRDAMARRGIAAEVIDGETTGTFKVIPLREN
ncbi:MAG: glycosyltransferase [bacterium]|nr:glycosyltransferase [bacterium]